MAVLAVYCAIPAPDLNFAIGDQVSTGAVHHILLDLIGETPPNASKPGPEPPITGFVSIDEPPVALRTSLRAKIAELIFPRFDHQDHPTLRMLARSAGPPLLEFADETTWPLANSNLLAGAFCGVAILWLRQRRRLSMLLPWLALMIIGQILWTAEHHAGMLLIALLVGFWLAQTTQPETEAAPNMERAFVTLLAIVLLIQVAWSASSIRNDVLYSYDPGPETAHWLQSHPKPRMAAFGFATVSIQPWFQKSPFIDVPTSYWQWSQNIEVDGIHRQIIASHPDLVVYGVEFPSYGQMRDQWLPLTHISLAEETYLPRDFVVRDLHEHGYVETHRFCGTRFARFSSAYRICDIVFEPAPSFPTLRPRDDR